MHKNTLLCIGIAILFICMGITPSVAVDTVKKSTMPISDKFGASDDYKEIISTVRGTGKGASWRWQVIPILILDLYLHQGKYYINCFTRDPLKLFYHAKAKSIRMKTFIGIAVMTPDYVNTVIGIAIGDITWEPYE